MKSNIHRKYYRPDYFAWFMYCQHAALNQKRFDKRQAKRKIRRINKMEVKKMEVIAISALISFSLGYLICGILMSHRDDN